MRFGLSIHLTVAHVLADGARHTCTMVLLHQQVSLTGMHLAVQDVCDFCNYHLEANQAAFANPKLQLIYDDAKAQLQQAHGTFDVIVADLADPVYGGPCYQVMLHISKHEFQCTDELCLNVVHMTLDVVNMHFAAVLGTAFRSEQVEIS